MKNLCSNMVYTCEDIVEVQEVNAFLNLLCSNMVRPKHDETLVPL